MSIWAYCRLRLKVLLGLQQGAAFRTLPRRRRRLAAIRGASPHPLAADYHLLGAPLGASIPEVRRCWLRQMREHHPDRHGADPHRHHAASRHSQALNAAYDRIRRAESRTPPL